MTDLRSTRPGSLYFRAAVITLLASNALVLVAILWTLDHDITWLGGYLTENFGALCSR